MTAASNDSPKRGSFYAESMSDEDRERFMRALGVEGIDEEVAMLRVTLRRQFEGHPAQYDALLRNADLLVRAVAAQYRMSPKSAHDFAERLTATIRDLGEQIAPGVIGGGDV
jgi:hypothetical protein